MTSPLRGQGLAVWLYLSNAVLLTVHEIDSAYWHEWDLFRLPGGNQMFLLLHLPLLALVLDGFRRVVTWQAGAKAYSLALAAAGLFAFGIHVSFIALGHPEFRQPTSLGVLVAILILSLAQMTVVVRAPAPGGDAADG